MARVDRLYRYPVKGFSPEALDAVELEAGRPIAGDRIYAVENGPSGFDPAAPAFQPKMKFLCLMKNARLAKLSTELDAGTHVWSIEGHGEPFCADLSTPEGRGAAETYLSAFMGEERRGALKVLSAPGHSFSDVGKPFISFINLATVGELDGMFGKPVDPLRFRGNFYLADVAPWAEFEWVGREAMLGGAHIRFIKRTQRCVATNVDPATAERDMEIPSTLMRQLGHMDCGVYAEVISAGSIGVGGELRLL